MMKTLAVVLVFVFLSVAIVYPTYAIQQMILEDWRLYAEGFTSPQAFYETMQLRYQLGMTFLIAVEIVCIAIASIALYTMEREEAKGTMAF